MRELDVEMREEIDGNFRILHVAFVLRHSYKKFCQTLRASYPFTLGLRSLPKQIFLHQIFTNWVIEVLVLFKGLHR